jgi:hypothetical protein
MLFGEITAVCCENHAEHINTLCGQNAEMGTIVPCRYRWTRPPTVYRDGGLSTLRVTANILNQQ